MRTFREEPRVSEAVAKAELTWDRARDAWDAITWAIVRDPKIGIVMTESGRTRMVVLDGARSIGLPTVRLIYEIGNPEITLHEAIFEESKFSKSGHA